MVNITIEGDNIIFEVQGWDKLWSLHSRLTIPVSHIRAVRADPQPAMGWFEGIRLVGTGIPNLFRAGTFYQEGDLVFWDVRNPENTIVIELDHEHFEKLIVEVADPVATVAMLNKFLVSA